MYIHYIYVYINKFAFVDIFYNNYFDFITDIHA